MGLLKKKDRRKKKGKSQQTSLGQLKAIISSWDIKKKLISPAHTLEINATNNNQQQEK